MRIIQKLKPVFRHGRVQWTVRRCLCFCLWFSLLFNAGDVLAFPSITSQPVSITASVGQTKSFTVVVTQIGSTSPLYVQWRRNGQNIPGTLALALPGLGISTLTVTNVQPSDSGNYTAVAFDADGALNSITVSLTIPNLLQVALTNSFALRGSLDSRLFSGSVGANNFGATAELGEPKIAGKPGGASVWVSWTAPTTGLARFDTRGSDFDTTLGIFTNLAPTSPSVSNLVSVVGDDDSGNYFNSSVAFNAQGGKEYEIGIDGFYGDTGRVVLNWTLTQTSDQIPIIVTQPQSATVASNASVTLSVTVDTNAAPRSPQYFWLFNGNVMPLATNAALTIPAVTPANVGQYRVFIRFLDQSPTNFLLSQPADIQINSEGNTSAQAQAKFREATDPASGLQPSLVFHPLAVPVSGFTGTHIYNTYGAASEPGEPNHCGKAGGSPYWFSYQAPANGNLTFDANTPTFTNVLAVYTWPGGDFSTLVSVACASTNNGTGHETAVFPAKNGTTYYLVVDGLNGAVGIVTLTYNLASRPAITSQPQTQTVPQGSNVTVSISASGTTPLFYQWRTNALKLSGQTNFSLSLTNFQATNQGNYDVVVTNSAGAVTSAVAALYLNSPLRFGSMAFSPTGGFAATLLGMANSNYVLQASSNLVSWLSITTNSSPFGVVSLTDTNTRNYPNRFYRTVKP